jgi:nucleoside-diphosphate-sugar epimerase
MRPSWADSIRGDCREVIDMQGAERLAPLAGKHLLVAGGTGFVGLWLAELVATLNDEQDFGTRLTLSSRHCEALTARAPHLARRADITTLEADVRDIGTLADANFVINAAATPDSRMHASSPIEVAYSIGRGASNLLGLVYRSEGVERFMQVSSGLVYGSQPLDVAGLPEGFEGGPVCDSVSSVYAEAKRFAETECAAWRSQYKLPIVTARPFAFVGPYQELDKPWAVNNFLRDAIAGTPIRILGDGDTERSYMYASDMAYWMAAILVAGVVGNAYNVGSPEAVRLDKLAQRIAAIVEPTPEIRSRTGGARQPSRFVPDVSKAEDTLGLAVTVGLDDALGRTIAWHRQRQDSMSGRGGVTA